MSQSMPVFVILIRTKKKKTCAFSVSVGKEFCGGKEAAGKAAVNAASKR